MEDLEAANEVDGQSWIPSAFSSAGYHSCADLAAGHQETDLGESEVREFFPMNMLIFHSKHLPEARVPPKNQLLFEAFGNLQAC